MPDYYEQIDELKAKRLLHTVGRAYPACDCLQCEASFLASCLGQPLPPPIESTPAKSPNYFQVLWNENGYDK